MKNGRITHIGPQRAAVAAAETIDLEGLLALPGFVDGHIHLDKSFVGDRWRPHQNVATLRERLAVEKRELASAPPILSTWREPKWCATASPVKRQIVMATENAA